MNHAIRWVEGDQGLAGLDEAAWDGLLDAASRPSDRHCWYAAWSKAFARAREPVVCTAWRDDRLIAALPLLRSGAGRLEAMANAHTPAFRPLARDAEALRAVVRAALEAGSEGLELGRVGEDDPALSVLHGQAQAAGRHALFEPTQISPVVDTGGDYDAWRRLTKSRWGAPLERFRRKMAREHDAEFVTMEPPSDLERELEEGFAVEASGWKGEASSAILSSEDTATFYREVAAAFHARGELRLSRIVLDGRLAAFDLCLLHGRRLYLLKTGYDERFRRLAPGLVMRLVTIERCFELGLEGHELLGGNDEWKRKFATSEWAHGTFRAYPRGPRGGGSYAWRRFLRPAAKRLYRAARARQLPLSARTGRGSPRGSADGPRKQATGRGGDDAARRAR